MVAVVCGVIAFNTPIIQERFFDRNSGHAGTGTINDVASGNFDSAGRFDAWPLIYRKGWDQPWLGHGVGQSNPFTLKVWAPMDKPHNEYLKVFFDNGIVGLACFVFALAGTWWNLTSVMRESRELGIENWPAIAAYLGLGTFAMIAFVDNPLVLGNNFLHPVFAMIGAANAILHNAKRRAERTTHASVPLRQLGTISSNKRRREPEITGKEDSDPPSSSSRPPLVPLR